MMKRSDSSNATLSVIWDSYPKNAVYFNSFAPMDSPAKKQIFKEETLGRLLFVMGSDLTVERYDVRGIPYYSIRSTQKEYNDLTMELPPFFNAFFPSIRSFWNGYSDPFYFVAVLPIQYAGLTRAGGFGMENGFLMKYLGEFDTWEKLIIAHETSHSWIGLKLQIGTTSFENQWFGEGFNDYITIINMAKSKLLSPSEFMDYLNNENLKEHYSSPVREESNATIGAKYWLDYNNYGKLPYRRGLIYAFYLDNQIQLTSKGKSSLRDFMLDLLAFRAIKPTNEPITLEDFSTLGSKYIPYHQLKDDIERYMIQGKLIDFTAIRLLPMFELYVTDNNIPQLHLIHENDLEKLYQW